MVKKFVENRYFQKKTIRYNKTHRLKKNIPVFFIQRKKRWNLSYQQLRKKFFLQNLFLKNKKNKEKRSWILKKLSRLYSQQRNRFHKHFDNKLIKKSFRKPYPVKRQFVPRKHRGLRHTRWFKNKKPYWRRKRYKKFRFFRYYVCGTFRVASDTESKVWLPYFYRQLENRINKLRNKKESTYIYFRRRKTKFWFRNKIFLRYMWRSRYACTTHNKMDLLIRRLRRVRPALFNFILHLELRLERFVVWWELIPVSFKREPEYIRMLIESGYIWVNFIPQYNYRYMVKTNDCVFFFNMWRRKTILKMFPIVTMHFLNPGTTRWLSGYQKVDGPFIERANIKKLLRFTKNKKQRKSIFLQNTFLKFILKYYYLKNFPLTKNFQFFLSYYFYFEKSYKYKLFVILHPYTWSIFMLSCGFSLFRINFVHINQIVNRRYY